jgi:hypothetical protein
MARANQPMLGLDAGAMVAMVRSRSEVSLLTRAAITSVECGDGHSRLIQSTCLPSDDVRSGLKATEALHHREMSRWADVDINKASTVRHSPARHFVL